MNKNARSADISAESMTEPRRRRLPAYYRALLRLYARGEEIVSSEKLADIIGIAPSQVRGDMSFIGCYGQTGYGYQIAKLYRRIGEVMKVCDCYSAVIVGDGALAQTVSECALFTRRGVKLIGRIATSDAPTDDTDPVASSSSEQGGLGGADASEMTLLRLGKLCRENAADILILACDAVTATRCAEMAEDLGMLGIWNFSDAEIVSESLAVRNLHIEDSLMMLCSELPKRAFGV